MRVPWKWIGLAGLAGVVGAGQLGPEGRQHPAQLLLAAGVAEGEHRHAVLDLTEGLHRRRAHAQGGAVVAHEMGHTLGFAHNFMAHAYGRASVMDYPGPLVTLRKDGTIDISQVWRNGTGAYDTLAARYAYTQYASPAEEKAGLSALMRDAIAKDVSFLTDRDADAGVTPEITRWLNGDNAVTELERQSAVRDALLARFNDNVIANGDPMWMLSERLVPVYLHHRYAIEAAIKAVGGMNYTFALRGDAQIPATIVDPAKQRQALSALLVWLLRTLKPELQGAG